MTKITNLPLAAITAGTLIALAAGPAFGQPPKDLVNNTDELLNLLEPKTIFVTSDVYTGNLVLEANTLLGTSFSASEGLEAGDALCQTLADAPGSIVPEAEYVALLSTVEVNAAARITPSSGPYLRPDGLYVNPNAAAFWTPLDGNFLINEVDIDETGETDTVTMEVWTGSLQTGGFGEFTCNGWGSADPGLMGRLGVSELRHLGWINANEPPCNSLAHLYCVGL